MLKTVFFMVMGVGVLISSSFLFTMIRKPFGIIVRVESQADLQQVWADSTLSTTAISSSICDTDDIFKVVYENADQYKYIHFPVYISRREIEEAKTVGTQLIRKIKKSVIYQIIPIDLSFEKNELFDAIIGEYNKQNRTLEDIELFYEISDKSINKNCNRRNNFDFEIIEEDVIREKFNFDVEEYSELLGAIEDNKTKIVVQVVQNELLGNISDECDKQRRELEDVVLFNNIFDEFIEKDSERLGAMEDTSSYIAVQNELLDNISDECDDTRRELEDVVLLNQDSSTNLISNENESPVQKSSKSSKTREKYNLREKKDKDNNTKIVVRGDVSKIESGWSWMQFFTIKRMIGIGVIGTATVFLYLKWDDIKNVCQVWKSSQTWHTF